MSDEIEELTIDPGVHGDHAVVSWRRGSRWSTLSHDADDDERICDAEDALGVALGLHAPIHLVRSALAAAYPDFDLAGWFEHVQMPDRADRRADDAEHRAHLKAHFKGEGAP